MIAKQSCWTCKRRKIGCDRVLPGCDNCKRTGRECLGYGLRLIWPDRYDGRRRRGDPIAYSPPVDGSLPVALYGRYFINTSSRDVRFARSSTHGHHFMRRFQVQPRRSLSLHVPILGEDAILLSYYENVISPMISTTQVQNGFCKTLVPMALSSQCASAHALLNAMQAVSAIHQTGSIAAATQFKLKAVHNLTRSLSLDQCSAGSEATEIQLAAAMMLCVYDVFDKEEGNWHIHLRGAKDVARKRRFVTKHDPDSDFILTWLLYHDVLAAFTQPLWGDYGHPVNPDLPCLLQSFGGDKSFIVGSLGCSVEVLEIIHHINGMRLITTQYSKTLILQRYESEARLLNLKQELEPGENSEGLRACRILATAELYRLAALLYVQRVCPSPTDDTTRPVYLQQAIQILQSMEVATSPWPVFVVACEIPDEERVSLLRTLDQMDSVRSIGNIKVLREVIEGIWKQHDLGNTSDYRQSNGWLQFVDCEVPVPWFI